MEYDKTSSDPLDFETIGKAFLSHICTIDFEPYSVNDRLPIKYRIERIQNHDKRLGQKIEKFWTEATEDNIQKKVKRYDPVVLNDFAEHDMYGLLKAAARAIKFTNYSEIGKTVIQIYNTYKKDRGKRPPNPKVLPERLKKGLESLV